MVVNCDFHLIIRVLFVWASIGKYLPMDGTRRPKGLEMPRGIVVVPWLKSRGWGIMGLFSLVPKGISSEFFQRLNRF